MSMKQNVLVCLFGKELKKPQPLGYLKLVNFVKIKIKELSTTKVKCTPKTFKLYSDFQVNLWTYLKTRKKD